MRFRDLISIYSSKTTRYNQTPVIDSSDIHAVMGVIEQNAGLTRGGYIDQLSGDAHLYLPGDDQWLKSIDYALEGKFVQYESRVYRVIAVSIGKAALTNNRIKLIECTLEKVEKSI